MTATNRPAPIALTMGEPAGIGGEIARAAWLRRDQETIPPFVLIDDPARMRALDAILGGGTAFVEINTPDEALEVFPNAIPILSQPLPVPVTPGRPDPANTNAVLASIDRAVTLCKSGWASAMVTNPINKAVLYAGGFRHPGHTEYLADLANVPRTVMMLAGGGLRAIPVTVHTSLRDAISTLTSDLIVETARILNTDLRRYFGLETPRIAVAGLNPHAGEGGALGIEEQEILAPALDLLRKEGMTILGPLPADTMFHTEARATYDAALCMYHDQALIPVKTLDFHGGVNVTLGLPFIRTSPDHGTAFEIAGTGVARPDSLISALHLAATMASTRS
ncbi:MAG: 4-hydroxythreonine-4-phosphate dehydrogenase PdxA [Alphaproteobacteria bacterium]|nr:4-hydroxythreonine-4-phosphate dehydrogenase PdxA [Alphaproteobacteria bacterium]